MLSIGWIIKYDLSVNPDRQWQLKGQASPCGPQHTLQGLEATMVHSSAGIKKTCLVLDLTH